MPTVSLRSPSHSGRLPNIWLVASCIALFAMNHGCNREPRGGPRVPVIPVTGKLLIDGKPANEVLIFFTPVVDRGFKIAAPNPEGLTDAEGNISLSTYNTGDGAPPGEYQLTFEWSTLNPITGNYGGDRLKGKYKDLKKSKHTVKVTEDDELVDLGTIELSSH